MFWLHIYSHWRGHLLSLNNRKKQVDNIFAKTLSAVDFLYKDINKTTSYTINSGIACYLCMAADKLCANTCDRIKYAPLVQVFF